MQKKQINVLHILSSFGLGGTERLILYLIQYWDNPNIKLHLCTLFSKDNQKEEPLLDEIRKFNVPLYRLSLKSWRDFKTFNKLLSIIKTNNIDIVHSHSGVVEFWGPFLAKIAHVRHIVLTKHHTSHPQQIIKRIQRTISSIFFCNTIIAVSHTVKKFLINGYFIHDEKKINVIYNPVDLNKFHPDQKVRSDLRNELNISESDFIVGNTSRFDPMKGHKYFIGAAMLIKQQIPNAKFLIIVRESDKKICLNMFPNNELKKSFIIIPPNNYIYKLLQILDLFLFTSVYGEGFGIVLIEAMASGIPIVASNIGPTKEIVMDEYNGIVPTPRKWMSKTDWLDIKLLADGVLKIYKNSNLKNRLIRNGYKSLHSFSIEEYIDNLAQLYISIYRKF